MLIPTQLSHEPELFDALVDALEQSEELDSIYASDEPDGYGNHGYITITLNGRRFRLEIAELT